MNKIYIDTNHYELVIKEDTTYYLINNVDNLDLEIKVLENKKGIVYLEAIKKKVIIKSSVKDNGSLLVNSLGIDTSIASDITLNNNSTLRFASSIASNVDTINKITINQVGENSKAEYLANGVNLGGNKFHFLIDGIINKESRGSFLEEDSNIINLKDGDSKIIPNMIINNEDVSANHSAYIGKIKNEDIYYLESRGIPRSDIEKILLKASLLKGIEDEVKKQFTSIINREIKF